MPGGRGAVCNVAINLGVHVAFTPNESSTLKLLHEASGHEETVVLPFPILHQKPKTLAEAAVAAINLGGNQGGDVIVRSDTPPGSSLGGSATYSVALLVALDPARLSDRHALAALAQELETKWLGHSCGTQDQMAAAYGGISFSEITYPEFTQEQIQLSEDFLHRFESSLLLVYTGESHFSSGMHHTVIDELERGVDSVVSAFHHLHECAREAASALRSEDINHYKAVVNQNWEAQKALHKDITTDTIESLHQAVLALDQNAAFKGSGAGGGGSVAVLVEPDKRAEIADSIKTTFPSMKVWDDVSINTSGVAIQNQ
jgi:D-glycero-alpha-D-manno-heptose-7-phosphate kinase